MNIAPMNKTEIISFIICECALTLRNVSKSMRKRVHWKLKDRMIKLVKYDKRALVLNGWVGALYANDPTKSCFMEEGIGNWTVRDNIQMITIAYLNPNIRVTQIIGFTPRFAYHFELVSILHVNSNSFPYYIRCTFNKIANLYIRGLFNNQISKFLSKVNQIDFLSINSRFISELDLRFSNIRALELKCCTLKRKVSLPKVLDELCLFFTSGEKFIDCRRIQFLTYFTKDTDLDWLKNLKGIKTFKCNIDLPILMPYLPSSVRVLDYDENYFHSSSSFSKIEKKFPHLISIKGHIPIETCQQLNLKDIKPILDDTTLISLKPRKIKVTPQNVAELNKHPELFEKVDHVVIGHSSFDLGHLTQRIKTVIFNADPNEMSAVLSRF